jgi:hypothetical protein
MEHIFQNLQQVRKHLFGLGFKISKTSIYDHGKTGKIKTRQDGLFHIEDVEQYANAFLRPKTGRNPLSDVMNRRNEAEARKMEAQAMHWRIKADILSGQYVRRDSFERELAYRALIFKNDIEAFCRAQASVIVELTDGDKEKVPDLIEYMLAAAAGWLNRYAADREFEVPTLGKNLEIDDEENIADILDNESMTGPENDD